MALTIPALLAQAACRWPDRPALLEGDRTWCWTELHDDVRRAASGLRCRGLTRGEVVGIWAPNSARWVVAALAVLEAGGVLAPLSSRLRGYEVLEMLAEVGSRRLLLQPDFLGRDYVAMLTEAAGSTGVVLPEVVALTEATDPAPTLMADHTDDTDAPAEPDDPADILFTSGTTGRSRGVTMTQAQVTALAASWVERAGLTADDRYLVLSPLSHTFGYKTGLVACLVAGATIIPAAVAEPAAVADLLRRTRATVLPGVPAALRALVTSTRLPPTADLDVRLVVTGGAPSTPAEIRELATALGAERMISAYGLTEAGPVTMTERATALDRVATTVGTPLPEVEVRIRGGGTGEILVRSPFTGTGPSVAVEDGWLATGDVGRLDADGDLTIVDRLKDVLQTGGFSVFPAEVERVLGELPGVAEAAVVGIADERLGEVGVAFLVAAPGADLDPAAVLAHCRDRLAGFKVPRRVQLVAALPRNATGKVLKADLREQVDTP